MSSSRATPAVVAATATTAALLIGAVVLAAMAGSPRGEAESPAAVGPAVIVLDRGIETDRVVRVPLDPASPMIVAHEATGIRAVAVTGDDVLVARDGALEEVGSYSAVHDVSPEGRSALVADDDGGLVVDLESGDLRRIPAPIVADRESFPGEVSSVDGRTMVQRVAVPSESRDSFAVTPVVAGAASDGRSVDPQPTSITLAIVEVGTGALVRTVEGFAPSWAGD